MDTRQALRILHHGNDARMAARHAAFMLQLVQDFTHRLDKGRIRNLGQGNCLDSGAHDGFEVTNKEAPGPVHTHRDLSPSLGESVRNGCHALTRKSLLIGANTVLQVDLQNISGLLESAFHKTIADRGHEQDGAPQRQSLV